MRLLQTLKMPNKVELNYYLEDVVKILNHSEKENSVTLVFSDVRKGLSLEITKFEEDSLFYSQERYWRFRGKYSAH